MTQHESAIEQINLGYNHQEDRLLMRIGMKDKTEVSLWISRRICKVLWHLLQDIKTGVSVAYQPNAIPLVSDLANKEQLLASFARQASEEEMIENIDFHSAYSADRAAVTAQPLLVVDCTLVAPEGMAAYFSMQCASAQVIKIALNNELIFAMTNMLLLSTREAGWDLHMEDTQQKTAFHKTQQVLH